MLTSILRTVVPALWASFINWALVVVPLLEPHREELLAYGLPLAAIATAVLTAAWYAFWRWLEPKLPDWLKRAVLGSAKAPRYTAAQPAFPDIHINVSQTDNPQEVARIIAEQVHEQTRRAGGKHLAN